MSNPLDLTAQGLVEPDLYFRTLDALFGDARFSTIIVGLIQGDPVTCGIKMPPVLRAVRELRPAKPVIVAGLTRARPCLPSSSPRCVRWACRISPAPSVPCAPCSA